MFDVANTAPGAAKVRKHRAPNGALRLGDPREHEVFPAVRVRKHRAPNSALRPATIARLLMLGARVRKHRAPNGALRR